MSSFENLRTDKPQRRNRCKSCGVEGTAGSVNLSLMEKGPGGARDPQRVASSGMAICEPCGVRIFSALRARMDEERQA